MTSSQCIISGIMLYMSNLQPATIPFIPSSYDDATKQETEKLNKLNKIANENVTQQTIAFKNMPIKEIFATIIQTFVDILQDLTTGSKPFFDIFFSVDRIMYVGFVVILLALFVWILHV